MNKSIAESNQWGAEIHIPIHTKRGRWRRSARHGLFQASGNLKIRPAGVQCAALHQFWEKGLRRPAWHGMTSGNYMPSELSDTTAVALYCECEFHDNEALAKWIIGHVDEIGAAITKAFVMPTENVS